MRGWRNKRTGLTRASACELYEVSILIQDGSEEQILITSAGND